MEEQKKVAPDVKAAVDLQVELQKYELRVKGMSHRQLVAELKGAANRKYNGKDFCMNPPKGMPLENRNSAGLDNAEAIVNLIVLENTQTAKVFEFKKNGDPKRFARKDQIGNGTMSHFLR
jgi:hypothetical protein